MTGDLISTEDTPARSANTPPSKTTHYSYTCPKPGGHRLCAPPRTTFSLGTNSSFDVASVLVEASVSHLHKSPSFSSTSASRSGSGSSSSITPPAIECDKSEENLIVEKGRDDSAVEGVRDCRSFRARWLRRLRRKRDIKIELRLSARDTSVSQPSLQRKRGVERT